MSRYGANAILGEQEAFHPLSRPHEDYQGITGHIFPTNYKILSRNPLEQMFMEAENGFSCPCAWRQILLMSNRKRKQFVFLGNQSKGTEALGNILIE